MAGGKGGNEMTKAIVGLLALGAVAFATTPVSAAKMMSCNGADLQKVNAMMPGMVEGANKTTMYKEMAMTNTAMSKGDMRGCATHLNMAAKAGMAK
jgi:hypothetical protein